MNTTALTYNANIVDWSNPVTKGLVGAFRCREGAGKMAFDASRLTLPPGTLTNDAVFKKGIIQGCNFDGTGDYITFGTNFKGYDNKSIVTISAIVCFTAITNGAIINRWSGAATNAGLWGLNTKNTGTWYFVVYNQTNWNNGYIYKITGAGSLVAGVKYHLLATWNGIANTVDLYTNGVKWTGALITSGTLPTTIEAKSVSTRIGCAEESSGINGLPINGIVGDALLWDRGLTDTEARQLYLTNNNIYL